MADAGSQPSRHSVRATGNDFDFGRSTTGFVDECRAGRCEFAVWEPAPQVLVDQVVGHFERPHAEAFLRAGNRMLARGRPFVVFHEWIGMTSYESISRQLLTEWFVKNLRSMPDIHVSVESKLVRMGVSVANLALGGVLHLHDDRASIARAFDTVVAKRF